MTDRSFEFTCIDGMYYVDGKRIDTTIETVAYYIRHMCGFSHLKRPSHHLIRRACLEAKDKGIATFIT